MADPSRSPQSRDGADVGPEREATAGAPRWVKAFGIVGIVALVVIVVVLLSGGGEHGPGRHLPAGDTSGVELPGSGDQPAEDGHVPAGGGHSPSGGGRG